MKKTWISSAHQGFVLPDMHSNTLSAFWLAALRGADMIETDARTTSDGVLIANHDPIVRGCNEKGEPVEYVIAETDSETILHTVLAPNDPYGVQYVPTLASVLHLCYATGMQVNIDLKEGAAHALDTAELVARHGMRSRTIYATNGSGAATIRELLRIDPEARFIDTPRNYTREALEGVPDYRAKCFAYTNDFSPENIARIRESGCMLASISLNAQNVLAGLAWHPEMAEYPHTSDFAALDALVLSRMRAALV